MPDMCKVMSDIYQIKIPLPGSPLKILNSYLIRGGEKHLLVDVGYNHDVSEQAMNDAFDVLGLRVEDANVFLTHLHGDHTGMIDRLRNKCEHIYISHYDGDVVNKTQSGEYWEESMAVQAHMGLPEDEKLHYTEHPGYRGGTLSHVDFDHIDDGDIIDVGRYQFEVIDLKGHTPGQKGLYEKKHKILISGDHILNDITPNINAWDFQNDYLAMFLESLKKVKAMDLDIILPGHRSLITQYKRRVDELLLHHEKRLAAAMNAIENGASTIYEVASELPWDFATRDFRTFPNEQKWFAGNEVFAHLEYLRRRDLIDYEVRDNTYHYFIKNKESD